MNQLVSYDEEWAKRAQAAALNEQLVGGTFLSTRGGTLSFGEETMPGNQACVIILAAVRENTFYTEKFDPEQAASPTCYAFAQNADEEKDMAPHPSMQSDLSYFKPQSASCAVCQWNEYGTADKGRGKACQNRRRLALIPAGMYKPRRGSRDFDLDLFNDPQHYATCDIVYLKLPPTSVKNWSKYTQQISSSLHRPPEAMITRVFLEPHPKHQYHVHFEPVEQVSDELAQIVLARCDEAQKAIIQGYRPPEEKTAEAPAGSLRGLRRR